MAELGAPWAVVDKKDLDKVAIPIDKVDVVGDGAGPVGLSIVGGLGLAAGAVLVYLLMRPRTEG